MQKKLKAVVDDLGDGTYRVGVTDWDTGEETIVTIKADTEKDAAFKAMEQVNDR
jgi:predicted RNA methylase